MRISGRPALLSIVLTSALALALLIALRQFLHRANVSALEWEPDNDIDAAVVQSVSDPTTICSTRQTPNYLESFEPSFEHDVYDEYWCTRTATECSYSLQHMGYDGNRSLHIQSDDSSLSCYWRTHNQDLPNLSLVAGQNYYFSGWIRTDNLESGAEAYISLRFWGPNGFSRRYLSTKVTTNTAENPGGEEEKWVPVCGVAEVPIRADRARIECRLDGGGYVWCDDLFLGLDIVPGLTKTAHSERVAPGHLLTYTITYSNAGWQSAWVRIREYLYRDADVEFVAATPEPDNPPYNDEWDIQSVAHDAGSIVVIVKVSSGTQKSCLTNLATMDSTCDLPSLDPIRLTRSVSTTVEVTPSVDGCAVDVRPPPNEEVSTSPGKLTLSHEVHNCGGIAANVTVTVSPPPTWVVTRPVTTIPNLPPGRSERVQVDLAVPSGIPSGTRTVTWTVVASCDDSGEIVDTVEIRSRLHSVFLPAIFRQYALPPTGVLCADPAGNPCNSDGKDPYEPNNAFCSTRTRLDSGIPVRAPMCPGYPDDPECSGDRDDYYYAYLSTECTLRIALEGMSEIEENYDLYLYHASHCTVENYDCYPPTDMSNNPGFVNEYITYHVPQDKLGLYYIRVNSHRGEPSWVSYTLSASCSPTALGD